VVEVALRDISNLSDSFARDCRIADTGRSRAQGSVNLPWRERPAEVVLQGFNFPVVMLDRAQSSDAASADSRAAAHENWAAPTQARPDNHEFNDEVPF